MSKRNSVTSQHVCAIAFAMCVLTLAAFHTRDSAADSKSPVSIRVAIYSDAGAIKGDVASIERCLPASKGFAAKTITAEQIQSGKLKDFDVILHPGGSASKQASTLGDDGRKAEQEFVSAGHGYVGICAGAYLGSSEYPWSLHLLNAHVLDRAHWARGQGDVDVKINATGKTALTADKEVCTIHFENGPLLGPGEKADINNFEPLAAFESEITTYAPPGVMKGTTAIARARFGNGRVICFSPHPEKTPGLEKLLQTAVRWSAGLESPDKK